MGPEAESGKKFLRFLEKIFSPLGPETRKSSQRKDFQALPVGKQAFSLLPAVGYKASCRVEYDGNH